MKMRMNPLLPVMLLDAKALLARAVATVRADEAGALARFDEPNGGF
jgi:hypothetical protein